MRTQQHIEWQIDPENEDGETFHIEGGALPSKGDRVDYGDSSYVVERIDWAIFNRESAPGGGCIDVYACVRLKLVGARKKRKG